MNQVSIRLAVPSDVEEIRKVHRKSILELAAQDYPSEIIAEWGVNRSPESIEQQKDAIRTGIEITWVAEWNGQIIGFSTLVSENEELRAVYVAGNAAKSGIGRKLLFALEEKATELNLKKLRLDSSITARLFYEKHGYKNLGKGFHRMLSGREMECYHMEKVLPK